MVNYNKSNETYSIGLEESDIVCKGNVALASGLLDEGTTILLIHDIIKIENNIVCVVLYMFDN